MNISHEGVFTPKAINISYSCKMFTDHDISPDLGDVVHFSEAYSYLYPWLRVELTMYFSN